MALLVRVHSRPPLSPVPTVSAWLSHVPRRRRTTASSPAVAVVCALRTYVAAISRSAAPAPLGSATTYMCRRGSFARPPATRAVSTPFGRPNVYVSAHSDRQKRLRILFFFQFSSFRHFHSRRRILRHEFSINMYSFRVQGEIFPALTQF